MKGEELGRKAFHVVMCIMDGSFVDPQLYMTKIAEEFLELLQTGVEVTPIIRLADGTLQRLPSFIHYPVLNSFIADGPMRQAIANIMMSASARHVCHWCCLPGTYDHAHHGMHFCQCFVLQVMYLY